MGTTAKQDVDFLSSVIGTGLLETSIEWIKNNVPINEVFSEKELLEYARDYDIEDVFDKNSLESWAESNGYIKE
jgi:hypothetical protein